MIRNDTYPRNSLLNTFIPEDRRLLKYIFLPYCSILVHVFDATTLITCKIATKSALPSILYAVERFGRSDWGAVQLENGKYARIWSHALYSGESVGPSGGSTFDSNQFSHSATSMDIEISFSCTFISFVWFENLNSSAWFYGKETEVAHTLFIGNRFTLFKRLGIISDELKLRAGICVAWSCATARSR